MKKTKRLAKDASGCRVLSHVLHEKTWSILEDNEIKDSDFHGEGKVTLNAIRKYYEDSGEFPTHEFIFEETQIEWPIEVALTPAIRRFKEWRLTKTIQEPFDRAQRHLEDQRPKMALDAIKEIVALGDLESDSKLLDVNETAVERYEEYIATKSEEIQGILPPFETWRNAILMFENGTVNSLLALQSKGKSWLSAYCSVHAAYVEKKNVLLISCENLTESMSKRIDSLYSNLNFGDLRAKMLDFRLEQKWEEKSKDMEKEDGNIWIADRSLIRNIHDVYQQFIAKKPDFVVIDGAYKLSGVDFKESSALLQSICDYASLSKVPWLITSQLNEAANHAKTATERTYSARGNKGYTIDVATVLSITQSPELELLNNVVECNVDKIRENGKSGDFKKKFHLQMSMDFTTIKEFSLDSYKDEEILAIT